MANGIKTESNMEACKTDWKVGICNKLDVEQEALVEHLLLDQSMDDGYFSNSPSNAGSIPATPDPNLTKKCDTTNGELYRQLVINTNNLYDQDDQSSWSVRAVEIYKTLKRYEVNLDKEYQKKEKETNLRRLQFLRQQHKERQELLRQQQELDLRAQEEEAKAMRAAMLADDHRQQILQEMEKKKLASLNQTPALRAIKAASNTTRSIFEATKTVPNIANFLQRAHDAHQAGFNAQGSSGLLRQKAFNDLRLPIGTHEAAAHINKNTYGSAFNAANPALRTKNAAFNSAHSATKTPFMTYNNRKTASGTHNTAFEPLAGAVNVPNRSFNGTVRAYDSHYRTFQVSKTGSNKRYAGKRPALPRPMKAAKAKLEDGPIKPLEAAFLAPRPEEEATLALKRMLGLEI